MKITEQIKKYREMKDADLANELKNIKKELALLSLKVKVGKQDDISQVDKVRRNIARINSIVTERAYGESNE